MERDWNLEYDKTLHHYHFPLSHWSYYFLLLPLIQSSHLQCHYYLPLQMLHYLKNHLTLKVQGNDQGHRSQVRGFQLHPETREVIHKQSQLHIYQQNMTGFVLLNSHILFQLYLSSGPGLVVN